MRATMTALACLITMLPNCVGAAPPTLLNCSGIPAVSKPTPITTSSGVFDVYEDLRNVRLPVGERCYYVSPKVFFSSRDARTPDMDVSSYGGTTLAAIKLVLVYPDLQEVLESCRRAGLEIDRGQISSVRYHNLTVVHPFFKTASLVPAEMRASRIATSNRTLAIDLESAPGRALAARDFARRLQRGQGTLKIRAEITEGESRAREASLRWEDIAKTRSLAEFVQACKGKKILASQVLQLSMEVVRELESAWYDEFVAGDEGSPFLPVASQIAAEILSHASRTTIDVEDMRDMIAPYVIDRNARQFQPSYVKEYYLNVTNRGSKDTRDTYKRDFRNHIKHEHNLDIITRGKASFLGIFGGSASNEFSRSGMSDTELDDLIERTNFFKSSFDRSFQVKWSGEYIERIDVNVYETLQIDPIIRKGGMVVVAIRGTRERVEVPIAISANDVHVHTGLETLPVAPVTR